ncbi:hypothetical protein NIES4074_61140 (plasmid) [Cylindrospermum sp. NIES-4074]|nr:hypothetical protein NIES4074_61140 [Cylindrospermum sp. NIES-4074]
MPVVDGALLKKQESAIRNVLVARLSLLPELYGNNH